MSDRTFTDGPAVLPADALRAWLEASGGKRVRLPLQLTLSPLGVTKATVGSDPGALELRLDSTALSMTLMDHLSRHCDTKAPTCAVWIEGTWGAVMPGLPGPGGSKPTLAVRAVVGPLDAGAPLKAQIEG